MEISETDIRNTLLHVFARGGFLCGDAMSMARVEQQWADTTLRRSDLIVGIARLCTQGLLDLDERTGEARLSLSKAGEAQCTELFSAGLGEWDHYLHQTLLPAVRGHSKLRRAPDGGRRSYETPATHIPFTHA